MSFPNNEGPTFVPQRVVVVDEYTTCQGCKFHEHKLFISGRNPVYDHTCNHPELIGDNLIEHDLYGKKIITPEWCPFLKPQS